MKFFDLSHVALASVVASSVAALSPAQWREQSIYQIVTDRFARTDGSTTVSCDVNNYCGGSWQGIINKLDYIQNMGFTAIWISPIVENLVGSSADGSAYHGYWAQNINVLNSNFGSESDLVALSSALHARGMYLMVDVVINHMGFLGCGTCVDYSVFTPFNSQSYFHPFCLIDYNNATSVKVCWEGDNTVSLPDLRTEDSDVRSTWATWISNLVSTYSIDGIRLDSAIEVDTASLASFQSASGVYVIGEANNGDPTVACPYQQYLSGILNFPAYFWVIQAFESTSGSISNLVNGINTMKSDCADTTLLGSFMENHDLPRFPSLTSDMSLTKNAIAFNILADGIPIIYYGQEQHFSGGSTPNNREALWTSGYSTSATLYSFIASVNQIRNQAIYKDGSYVTYKAYPVYSDSSTIVMRKGDSGYQVIGVFSNLGASGSSYTLSLPSSDTGFTASESLVDVLSCTKYTTDSSGNLAVTMAGGLPRVFYPLAQLTGSGICSAVTGSTTATATSTQATSTATSCAAATSVAVTFDEKVITVVGQTIKILGNNAALGNWAPSSAVALSASQYTTSNPLWFVTLSLTPGEVIQYKYINVDSAGDVTWKADPNHTYTVPATCATAATEVDTWQT